MKTGYKVCDAMTQNPIAVSPESSLQECARVMEANHVGALVIKKGEAIVGIVTEQDIVRKAVAHNMNPKTTKVSEVMAADVKKIEPGKDIFEALVYMKDKNIRHLPVSDNGKLLGLLTTKDILKIEPQLFDILVETIELREEERKPIKEQSPDEGICEICGECAAKISNVAGSRVCIKCKDSV